MSQLSRQRLEADLSTAERRFGERLVQSLKACADGTWGMFGQNDAVYEEAFGSESPQSKDGQHLLAMVAQIEELRSHLGYAEPNPLCAKYREYRALRGSNVPGEPKLAAKFLAELEE